STTSAHIRDLFQRLPLELSVPREMTARPGGTFATGEVDRRIAIAPDGSFDAAFGEANRHNHAALPLQTAVTAAHAFVRPPGLDREGVVFDRVIRNWENGGSPAGSGILETPRVTESVVQFTQVINGLPVIAPGQGKVIVRLDNDQRIVGATDTTRAVA